MKNPRIRSALAALLGIWVSAALAAPPVVLQDRTAFLLATSGAPMAVQDFEVYPTGTPLNGVQILPGVVIDATAPTLQSWEWAANHMAFALGRDASTTTFGYDLTIAGGALALGLNLESVHPNTGPMTFTLFFEPGLGNASPLDVVLPPSNPDELTPMFVGFVSDVPIMALHYREGLETSGLCCEETALDDIMVQMAPVPEPATWATLLAGLAMLGRLMRRQRRRASAVALTLLLGAAGSSHAGVLASSSFEVGAEGWLVKDLPYPDPGAPPVVLGTYQPSWVAGGGTPDGHLSRLDVSDNTWYWSAPAAFLGNQTAAYGGSLQFDLAVTGKGFGDPSNFRQEDVILVGNGMTLVYDLQQTFMPTQQVSWVTSYVGLDSGRWTVGSLSGPAATAEELQLTLQSVSALYIRGEYLYGLDDVGRLDSVVLSSVPAPPAAMTLAFGLGLLAWFARGRSGRQGLGLSRPVA